MTNPNARLLVIVADRSTSMERIQKEMQDGLNSFVKDRIDDVAEDGARLDTRITLFQFNGNVEMSYRNRPASEVPAYELVPGGSTALLDALGMAIAGEGARLFKLPEEERPGKVIVLVVTDGEENSSKRYLRSQIREMVQRQEQQYGWTFIFMGADQDAVTAGADVAISERTSYSFASHNTQTAWTNTSGMVARGTASGLYAYTGEERDQVK